MNDHSSEQEHEDVECLRSAKGSWSAEKRTILYIAITSASATGWSLRDFAQHFRCFGTEWLTNCTDGVVAAGSRSSNKETAIRAVEFWSSARAGTR